MRQTGRVFMRQFDLWACPEEMLTLEFRRQRLSIYVTVGAIGLRTKACNIQPLNSPISNWKEMQNKTE